MNPPIRLVVFGLADAYCFSVQNTVASHSTTISVPFEAASAVLEDFFRVQVWNPFVSQSASLSEQKEGPGTLRSCTLKKKVLVEQVISWNFDNQSKHRWLCVRMTKNFPGVRSMLCKQSLKQLNNGETQFAMEFAYSMKPLLGIAGSTVFKKRLIRLCETLAIALQHYIVTGTKFEI